MTATELTQSLKAEANRLGFAQAGICPAVTPVGFARLSEWIDRGFAGEMAYFERRRAAYEHPSSVLAEVRSIVMLITPYLSVAPKSTFISQGRVSRYAWSGVDYHDVIHDRMTELGKFLQSQQPSARFRTVIDTAPLMERDFAVLAGLGWQGKNTLLLNKSLGSCFFLSALLTDLVLDYDEPFEADHCGTCNACLDACPTNAFVQPGVLDATRCISYLTIEHRTPIPRELREPMGNWIFGCDVCQDVCPWNNKPSPTLDANFQPAPELNPLNLHELFFLTEEQFRIRFRATPLWRPRRCGILRNAAIVLGNQSDASALDALCTGLQDSEPIVRGACAWALGRIECAAATAALKMQLAIELDSDVQLEIEWSLGETSRN